VWKALVVPALRGARALNLVEGKEPAPPETIEVTTDGQSEQVDNPAYDTWIARDQQVLRFLLNCLSSDMLSHVLGLETSAAVWKTINSLTTTQSKARTQQLRSALNDLKKGSMSAEKYFAKAKILASELAAAGKPLDDDELIWSLLHGLDGNYNNLKTAVRANPSTTLTDLFSQLQSFDQMNKLGDATEDDFTSYANLARRTAGSRQDDRRPDDYRRSDDYRDRRDDSRERRDDRRPRTDDRRDDRRPRFDDRRAGYDDRRRRDDGPRDGPRDDGRRRDRVPTPYVNVDCQICTKHGHPLARQ
jgi:hypothetical protein